MVFGDLARPPRGAQTGNCSVEVGGEGEELTRRSEAGYRVWVPAKEGPASPGGQNPDVGAR